MTSIRIPPDDIGIRDLQLDNARPTNAPALTPVSPSRAVQKSESRPPLTRVKKLERRAGERRRKERRTQHKQVLLDTRTQRDRRKRLGNRRTDQDMSKVIRRGIDTTV